MKNPTHLVTFFFGTTGSQQVKWNVPFLLKEHSKDKKFTIQGLAREWQNDLRATSHKLEAIAQ